MTLKQWRKERGHNAWINRLNDRRVSVSFVLNGEYKGKYDFTLGDSIKRGTRRILIEKHFDKQIQALKFAKKYMRLH